MNLLLIDGNSIGNSVASTHNLKLGDTQIGAVYGFIKWMRSTLATAPMYTPMVLWDGASWRSMNFPEYKAQRDKAEKDYEIAQQEAKASYRKQKPLIAKALEYLGVVQVSAINMEADDLAGIYVQRLENAPGRIRLMSADKDWLQLVGPKVSWHNGKRSVTAANFTEETGAANPAAFVEVKALHGDAGDNISGVGGIGEKGAIDFLNTYGSFRNFLNMVTFEKTVDLKKLPKKFRDLVEDEDKALIFDRNVKLMDLRTPHRPEPAGLVFNKGKPSAASFKTLCETLLFQSILKDFDEFVSVFPALAQHHIPQAA